MHGDGPLLIVAGAGTGKTRTLASRVAHLVSDGAPSDRILLLTFTRRASAEMIARAKALLADDGDGRVWGGTFHSMANRLLRQHGRVLGLDPCFTVMDESDAADLMNLVRGDLGVVRKDRRFPRKETLVRIYSHTVNAQKPLEEVLERHFPWCRDDLEGVVAIFKGYMERKKRQQLLDYDDLLLFWSALCDAPGVGARVGSMFDHILVDEYQDTNALQAEILRAMRRENSNITVVGDDAQSIYSFRAATVRNILEFPNHFPGCRVVTLDRNYRSIQPILDVSNAVMAAARERFTKELRAERSGQQRPVLLTCLDEAEQSAQVCRLILQHVEAGTCLMRQAVLFRAGHHSAHLEVELARRNVPFHKFGGLKFLEASHIKDLLAFLRIIDNPWDEIAWFRVFQLLDGVGPRTAHRLLDELGVRRASAEESTLGASPLGRLLASPPKVPRAAQEEFDDFRAMIGDCSGIKPVGTSAEVSSVNESSPEVESSRPQPAVSVQIERIRGFYEPICRRIHENPAPRLRDLDQLAMIASGYTSRSRFISELTLDPPQSTADLAGPPHLDDDWLTLSTIHSAKGCEWDVVHVIHAADGMIPSDMAIGDDAGIEEERRLFYVALTRARNHLYVHVPLRYYHRVGAMTDRHSYAQPTRFLTREVRGRLEEQSVGRAFGEFNDPAPSRATFDPYSRISKLMGQ